MILLDQIRQQAFDVENRVMDVEILLGSIVEKLDGMTDLGTQDNIRTNVINCFITCALRNTDLIKAHIEHMLSLSTTEESPEKGGVQ